MRITFFFLITFLFTAGLFSCKKDSEEELLPYTPSDDDEEEDDGDPDIGDVSGEGVFYDKFSEALDAAVWEALDQVWGQPTITAYQHGGVISDNVSVSAGNLVLRSLGDDYTGSLRGVNGFATRLGAVVKSKARFASGRYEVKMKVVQAPDMGVLSAAWTYWYQQITETTDPEAYAKAIAAGNIDDEGTITLNHEIDIEVKGVDLGGTLYTNWIGEQTGEYSSNESTLEKALDDNAFHVYRYDWHTGSSTETARVEYYIDDVLMYTSTTTVPYIAGYLYIGNWFAWWAGNDTGTYNPPAYAQKDMLVDWVKYTPFEEDGDDWLE